MSKRDLARMINQIADFFAAYPEAEAAAMVADHITKFWAPTMRRDLAGLMTDDDDALKPLARKAAGLVVAAADGKPG